MEAPWKWSPRVASLLLLGGVLCVSVFYSVTTAGKFSSLEKTLSNLQKENLQLHRNARVAENTIKAIRGENQRLVFERRELLALRAEVGQLRSKVFDLTEIPQRRNQLFAAFQDRPQAWVPGLSKVPDETWNAALAEPLDSETKLNKAMAKVRKAALRNLAAEVQKASRQFVREHEAHRPTSLQDLIPFMDEALGKELLWFSSMMPDGKGKRQYLQSKYQSTSGNMPQWSLEWEETAYHYQVWVGP